MEKVKLTQNSKIENISNIQKIGEKIDNLWSEKSSSSKNSKYETKKLIIKFETNGIEKRKIFLKLESGSPKASSSDYTLISELLKDFFNGSTRFK
ncbi:MAG: hypothetical protein ACFE9C_08695 [Candidatus Hodarchaeota archaeon]